MQCFNHPHTAAVGLCKCCSRGLCRECVSDLDHGLACRDRHEAQVEAMNMIIEKNARIYAAAPKNILIGPVFFLLLGLLFAGFGYFRAGGITQLPFLMGLAFIIFAIVSYVRSQALFREEP